MVRYIPNKEEGGAVEQYRSAAENETTPRGGVTVPQIGINSQIERCAFASRMPARAEQLSASIAQLKGKHRRRARAYMRQVQLCERMARRAAEVAHFNPHAAIRIVTAAEQLFAPRTVAKALAQAGYMERQSARADRHRRGGNLELAQLISDHLSELRSRLRDHPRPGRDRYGLVDPRVDVVSPSRARLSFAG